jgi:RNA polymerase sigma-70 factor (ECF subfamily)
MMLEDKLLIWKLNRGRVDALRQIYDRHKVDLLKVAISLTGDVGRAEDAVQDVFLKLIESSGRIGIRSSLKSYLMTCLVNRIRSLHRGDKCRDKTSVVIPASAMSRAGPEHWAVLDEQMRLVGRAMAQLPVEQREVVTLHVEAGLGFRQIARMQDTSVNTVHGRYRYGIEKLRSLLNGEVDT